LRRFADRFTRKNKHSGPRRRQSLPPKRSDHGLGSAWLLFYRCLVMLLHFNFLPNSLKPPLFKALQRQLLLPRWT
jgi:hypothetical protein